jgi:hypothetical protein
MRVTVLILVLVGVLGAPATSFAEKVRTNSKAKVYNRPGEQGKIVVRVKEGQAMTVLAKEGRWVKVRVAGRTGFIPRTYLDLPADDEEIARNTRRRPFVDGRSTKRSFGGSAPDDRIGEDATEDHGSMDEADDEGSDEASSDDDEDDKKPEKPEKKEKKEKKAEKKPKKSEKAEKASKASKDDADEDDEEDSSEGSDEDEPATEEEEEAKDERKKARVSEKTIAYSEPDKKSDKQFTATPKDMLFVESTKGKWTEVSVEEGDIGWILSSKLETDSDDDSGDEGGGSKKRIIDTRARLGFRLVSQRLTSKGGGMTWPDNYKIGSSAAAISLGGSLLFPYKKDFLVGGGIDYDLAYAIPGIAFDPDGPAEGSAPGGTTSFTMHTLRVRGFGGYNFHKKNGLVVLAKLGLHYESFMVANNIDLVKNTARLPSEVIKGPSLGLGLSIPRLTDKIGLTINLDAVLVGGSVTQTKNLEDGQDPSVKRYTVSGILNYEYSKGFDLNFGYDMNYATLTFGAPIATSMRMHTGTGVTRTDLNHTVSAGISKSF